MKKLFVILIVLFFAISAWADSALQVDFLLAGYRNPTTDKVLSGGKVLTFLDGTSTLSALWTDKDKGGTATNPVILDSSGKAEIYGDNIYKFEIYDSGGTLIETINGITYRIKSTTLLSLSSDYGCDLAAAIIAIGSTETTLLVDCDAIIASGTTVTTPSTLSLNIIKGGSIDGVAGGGTETLNINGPLSAGRYQIFGDDLTVSGSPKIGSVYPEWFGVVDDGDGEGAGTENSTDLQRFLDFVLATQIPLELAGDAIYRCDSALTMIQTVSDKYLKIKFITNNAMIDFTNLTGSASALTIGATGQPVFADHGITDLGDLRLRGPEPLPLDLAAVPETTTIGLNLSYASGVKLGQVDIQGFYAGIRTFFVFPLTSINSIVKRNYIGIYQNESSNNQYWLNTSAQSCRYSVVIEHTGVLATKIQNVVFQNLWTEGSLQGVTISCPDSSDTIRGVTFLDGFYKDMDYDTFRMGMQFTFATPEARGIPDVGKTYDLSITGGAWDANAATATRANLVFGTSGTGSEEVKDFRGSMSIERGTIGVVGEPGGGYIEYRSSESTPAIQNIPDYYKLGEIVRTLEEDGTITINTDPIEWTPVITCATLGDLSVGYTTQKATYNIIGPMVRIDFHITTSSFTHTTSAGAVEITGLPFAVSGVADIDFIGSASVLGVSKANVNQINTRGTLGDSHIEFETCGINGGTLGTLLITDMPNGGSVIIKGSLMYER